MLLTREFLEPRAPLKESHTIYFSSSASPGIVYIGMISKNQYAYGTLGQSQDIMFSWEINESFKTVEAAIRSVL